MNRSKLSAALTPIAVAGAFAAGVALHQRQAPAAPAGILGAGVYIPAHFGGFGHPGVGHPGITHPGIQHPGWNHPGGWSHPGGFAHPGVFHPGFLKPPATPRRGRSSR